MMTTTKNYTINDLFNIIGENSKLTKSYRQYHSGEYPVYSGQILKGEIAGHIDTFDHEGDYLIWTTYGNSAGHLKRAIGKLSIGKNAGGLELKEQFKGKIDLDYFLRTYQYLFIQNRRADNSGQRRMPHEIVKKLSVKIPIDDNGEISISIQESLKRRQQEILEIKEILCNQVAELKELKVNITEDYSLQNIQIMELFEIKRGLPKYTKKYGNINAGEYAVYSAANDEPLTSINHFDYNGEYLTWATNGFGGYMKVIKGRFSINGDRGILIPKSPNINLRYIRFVLEPVLREIAKGRKGEKGKNEFTKVSLNAIIKVHVKIPIDSNGCIDLNKQTEIADKYTELYKIRDEMIASLEELVTSHVEFF